MAKAACLSVELLSMSAPADAPLPTEFQIFKAGANHSTKGTKHFTEKSARDVMESWQGYGNDLCIDYGHAMFAFVSADPAEANKAAGWFRPEIREGGLWATGVTWTPAASKKLADREYRYVSPAFHHKEDGEITELLNVALTNIPATKGMTPLLASQTPDDEPEPAPMKTLLSLLALGADATEAAAVEAVQKLQTQQKEMLEMCSAKSSSEALGKVQAWKSAAEQLPEAQKRLEAIELASKKAEVDALLSSALAAGKVLPPQVEFLSAMGLSDPTRLKAYLDASSKQIPSPAQEPGTGNAGVAGLSKDELALATLFRNDPKKVAEVKARIEAGA